jgi:hypothetical protein
MSTIIEALHEKLFQHSAYNGVMCGGAARDELLGREPKDYDFVLLNDGDKLDVYDMINELNGISGVQVVTVYAKGYDKAQSERFDWCIKAEVWLGLHSGFVDVDIISLKKPVFTPEDVIDTFDFSINHAYIGQDFKPVAGKHFPQPGDIIKVLPEAELTGCRTARMRDKFPDYIWSDAVEATYRALA